MNHSVAEIRAVAEAALTAKNAEDAAKVALDADPENQTLKDAHAEAARVSADAKSKADALSQDDGKPPLNIPKMKKRYGILGKQLRDAGALEDEDDENDDEDDEDSRPVTFGDLKKIEAQRATQTAVQMAEAIGDPSAKASVITALSRVVPSGDPEKDFTDAVAIAYREKNSKVLEEIARGGTPTRHGSGAGAPPFQKKDENEGELTAEEKQYLLPPFSMTTAEILKLRGQ